jgi:hypothetical protein
MAAAPSRCGLPRFPAALPPRVGSSRAPPARNDRSSKGAPREPRWAGVAGFAQTPISTAAAIAAAIPRLITAHQSIEANWLGMVPCEQRQGGCGAALQTKERGRLRSAGHMSAHSGTFWASPPAVARPTIPPRRPRSVASAPPAASRGGPRGGAVACNTAHKRQQPWPADIRPSALPVAA